MSKRKKKLKRFLKKSDQIFQRYIDELGLKDIKYSLDGEFSIQLDSFLYMFSLKVCIESENERAGLTYLAPFIFPRDTPLKFWVLREDVRECLESCIRTYIWRQCCEQAISHLIYAGYPEAEQIIVQHDPNVYQFTDWNATTFQIGQSECSRKIWFTIGETLVLDINNLEEGIEFIKQRTIPMLEAYRMEYNRPTTLEKEER